MQRQYILRNFRCGVNISSSHLKVTDVAGR